MAELIPHVFHRTNGNLNDGSGYAYQIKADKDGKISYEILEKQDDRNGLTSKDVSIDAAKTGPVPVIIVNTAQINIAIAEKRKSTSI